MEGGSEHDVVIVGGGPAGLTAGLVLGRARRSVLVVDDGQPRNACSEALHGFPTRDGIAPLELLRLTREELEGYGVVVRHGRVVAARRSSPEESEHGFQVTVESGEVFRCRRLLLATGVRDVLPEIEGMLRYYGRGIYHCPYCDGWEVRDRPLVAYGAPSGAVGLALHLLSWSDDVTLCTGGQVLESGYRRKLERNGVRVVETPVARLEGGEAEGGRLESVVLADDERMPAAAIFLSVERVQHSALSEQLGCGTEEDGSVRVRGAQHTDVPGLYLAGDGAGDVHFAVVAAAEGARAAVAIHQDLEKEEIR
jgi:thioredoxin reductase